MQSLLRQGRKHTQRSRIHKSLKENYFCTLKYLFFHLNSLSIGHWLLRYTGKDGQSVWKHYLDHFRMETLEAKSICTHREWRWTSHSLFKHGVRTSRNPICWPISVLIKDVKEDICNEMWLILCLWLANASCFTVYRCFPQPSISSNCWAWHNCWHGNIFHHGWMLPLEASIAIVRIIIKNQHLKLRKIVDVFSVCLSKGLGSF